MTTVIMIDFGMTGSVAVWFHEDSRGRLDTAPQFWPQIGKIPTMLLYHDNEAEPVDWGEACVCNVKSTECFKVLFGLSEEVLADLRPTLPGIPQSVEELNKWILDYLSLFCKEVLEAIRIKHRYPTPSGMQWHLSTPGAWSPTRRRDFMMLASKVIKEISLDSEVIVEVSEAHAACTFLVEDLQLPGGLWAVTCDIGGATSDVALAITKVWGDKIIADVYPTRGDASGTGGVGAIDGNFFAYACQYLRDAGDPNFRSHSVELVRGEKWRYLRTSFVPRSDLASEIAQIPIGDYHVCIPWKTIETFFQPFLQSLYSLIDAAIAEMERLTSRHKKPDLLGICGGGAYMQYPKQMLSIRYPNIVQYPLTSAMALATVKGHTAYVINARAIQYLQRNWMGITDAPLDNIQWTVDSSTTSIFHFKSREGKVQHTFVVVDRAGRAAKPASLDEVRAEITGSWVLQIELGERRSQFQPRHKYSVKIGYIRPGQFTFSAYRQGDEAASLPLIGYAEITRGLPL